ncbi:hypothetical protein [Streptomyces sp. MZ04]|uniref:hypothetical protein n=1 Tax=Streptomyces sp. MZ04 TaxID=2559236 RepID=UPI00107EBAD1|nr:hypothetical protein [Streptomyces sp. MZ04]TGB03195.1 hypothetical protein E2651_25810 [Streptomyces sp. MZ04]
MTEGRAVHLAEGEKAADALHASGQAATCNSGGSAGWLDELADSLKGAAEVAVWQDRDDAGAKWTAAVTNSLEARGIPHRVVQSRTEGPADDAWDHIAAGWSAEQAVAVEVRAAELEFAPEASREVREEALRILRHREAMRLVTQYEASQRTNTTMTVSQALDALLSGEDMDVPPVARLEGDRSGRGLFYPGHVNGLFGDGSVGKSVIVAEVQARVLSEGGIVVHWEFDNNPVKAIVARLLHAGAEPDSMRDRFKVIYSVADRDALTGDVQRAVKLVTLDALNPAITSLGLDPYHPGGVDGVVREFFAPFTLHGACGLFVDHVGHESKDRQAGSIRKAQAVQGALYEVVKVAALKPGATGESRLVLRKDNRGGLGDMEGKTVATAVMTSEADKDGRPGRVRTTFRAPDPFVPDVQERTSLTREDNVRRIIAELDRAGIPNDVSIRGARGFLAHADVVIRAKTEDFATAVAARKLRPVPLGGPTDPHEEGYTG